jgi:hypothetical protein
VTCRRALPLLAAIALALSACAAKQHVSLECVPRDVTVYVDGRALEDRPDEIELRSDEPHTVFFKGGDYKPQMIVMESEETPDGHRLSPVDVCTHTTFEKLDPRVQMEIDPSLGEEP